MNENKLIFIHKGTGLFTLGEKNYEIGEGTVALVPKGVSHGLQNTGTENIENENGFYPFRI